MRPVIPLAWNDGTEMIFLVDRFYRFLSIVEENNAKMMAKEGQQAQLVFHSVDHINWIVSPEFRIQQIYPQLVAARLRPQHPLKTVGELFPTQENFKEIARFFNNPPPALMKAMEISVNTNLSDEGEVELLHHFLVDIAGKEH